MIIPTNTKFSCMLEASHLECIRGERRLFSGLGFRLDGGEVLYLQGKNGSGKTSLLRILCGLAHPAAGEVRWRGNSIHKPGEDYRRELCYLGHHNAIKDELTPLENLLASAQVAGKALDEGAALAAKLAAAPVSALGATRALLQASQTTTLAEHLDLEAKSISEAGAGPEGREGVAAFLARRKPDYRNLV